MITSRLSVARCVRLLAFAALPSILLALAAAQPAAVGTIEGRITNPATGGIVERARVTIDGTSLETFTNSDGYYRLTGAPTGNAQVRAFFTGFPAVAAPVTVAAGQTVQQDFQLSPGSSTAGTSASPIKLDEFVVATSREMSGAALAINEQRFAPNMKNVLATDEFGDIAEGNAAEFLKFMPGVNIDYAGGNGRDVSLNGVPSIYVPVTLDGFGLASAVGGGAGGTSRGVGLDQVSINNLSRIEVAYSPTPDSQGNALAGSVNLVPRSSFERTRPGGNFSAYLMLRDDIKHWGRTPAPRHPTHKIHPGLDFSYVAPLSKNFGFTLSAGINRQYSGEPQMQNTWVGTQAASNGNALPNTSFDQPYLTQVLVRNSGKDTKRSSFGLTTDYKFTPVDRLSLSLTYSTFDVHINHNELTFNVGRVNPGDFSLSQTRGAAGAGNLNLESTGQVRSNWTFMPSIVWRHDGRIWKLDSGFAYSRASNRQRNVEDGFFGTTTARKTGVTITYSDIFYLRPNVITVTDAAGAPVNPYTLDTYVMTAATQNTRATDDYKRTAYANVRRDFFSEIPITVKAGVDFRQASRDQRISTPAYTYVGRDGVASTTLTPTSDDRASPFLDPSFSDRQPSYGFPKFQGVSSELFHNHFAANPSFFTTNANTTYTAQVNNSKFADELISAAYLRGDVSLFRNRMKIVTGIRAEQTNVEAQGPLTDPNRNILRDAQGRPILLNGRPQPIVPATNALGVSQLTRVDRGAHAEKEYLRLFPSINVSYNLREDLIARAAWYTSIGRPDFNQYSGGVTLPDVEASPSNTNRITVNNAAIKAWSARTGKVSLEYYFERVGVFSVGAFRRDFKNFFGNTTFDATPEFLSLYGLDPVLYDPYQVATQENIESTVRMEGVDVNYKQALTFLPRWARGIQLFANGSAQRAIGPATSNFAGYIPRTGSWGISLSRERYNVRLNWNYI
ncbi:MAG TPA: carboxypeptidase regulatory-like domain-containing protein, partial [Opitutaceae bacterium]|nr:carboxypeptidase regulatory-like domain-containing protein [Opitutaceae bacterium]